MPEKAKSMKCVNELRHAEYYEMLNVFDDLYEQSKKGIIFENLMGLILSENNICLAYRNIKANKGSKTQGTDDITIETISKMTKQEVINFVRYIVMGSKHGYRPKPVRRKDIPKPYDQSKMRPLGIPCMWDRLVQQCIKQILEPICEAKFSSNNYGFRPLRSTHNAIRRCNNLMQLTKLNYVIEFDIKGFFDNVNHSKLIKQIWALGIRDKNLIWIIKQILKAPICMQDGNIVIPDKGTPQGGIISPLLANIVLNELDHWVESQWQVHPLIKKYSQSVNSNGSIDYGNGYKAMKKTKLKEMYIVRYCDDFRIFCRNKKDAQSGLISITMWLKDRLKLEVSPEKTRVVNLRKRYSEFLGIKMKVHLKSKKYVVKSHMSEKAIKKAKIKLTEQIKRISRPANNHERDEIILYNAMVSGIHNYYQMATHISKDCSKLQNSLRLVLHNRMNQPKGSRLSKSGRELTSYEQYRYGKSLQMRYAKASGEPIYPIGFVQHVIPKPIKFTVTGYSEEGRKNHHDKLQISLTSIHEYIRSQDNEKSIELLDNIISRYSSQWSKCSVTGRMLNDSKEINYHYRNLNNNAMDKYSNITIVSKVVHSLIHSIDFTEIKELLKHLKLQKKQLVKLNALRELINLPTL